MVLVSSSHGMNMAKLGTHRKILVACPNWCFMKNKEDHLIQYCVEVNSNHSNALGCLEILQAYFDHSILDIECLDMSSLNDLPWSIYNTPRKVDVTLKNKIETIVSDIYTN